MTALARPVGTRGRFAPKLDDLPRAPCVVTHAIDVCPLEVGDVFAAVQRAAAAWHGGEATNLGVWLDGRAASADLPNWLPSEADPGLEAYVARVLAASGARELCVSHFNLQRYDRALWRWARAFACAHADRFGPGRGEVDVDVFLGRYAVTPRGIHRDPADTFMFVLQGTKRLLFWPAETFANSPQRRGAPGAESLPGVRVEDWENEAVVLEGGPGTVFYWPADHWHVGCRETTDECGLALNVGFHHASDRTVAEACRQLCETLRVHFSARAREGDADTAVLDLLVDGALARPVQETVRWWRLRSESAAGFHAVPELEEPDTTIDPSGRWRMAAPAAVRWHLVECESKLEVAGQGHLRIVAASPPLVDWLRALTSTGEADWANGGPAARGAGSAAEVVGFLAAAGAIERVR